MAKIKAILERIKSKVSSEELAKIESDISEGISEDEKLYTQLADLRRESAERRERIQELETETAKQRAKNTELQTQVDKLSTITTTPEYKAVLEKAAKYDEVIEKQNAELKTKWAEKAKLLAVDSSSKLFAKVEKVKGKFILPAEGQELTLDQIRKNMETWDILETAGHFTVETTDTGGKAPVNNPNNNNQEFKFFTEKK